MEILTNRLLPHCPVGLALRLEADTYYLHGYEGGETPLEQIRSEWPDLVRQEARQRLRQGREAEALRQRPADWGDLTARLQLGRLKPPDQQRLNAYYDALDALDDAVAQLEAVIANLDVAALNALEWPEWVAWTPIPESPRFVLVEAPRN